MDVLITPVPKGKGRNRRADPKLWERTKMKCLRYQPKQMPDFPSCYHKTQKTFRCNKLKMSDINEFHQNFYKSHDKVTEDMFLLKYIETLPPARRRPKMKESSKKGVSIAYFVKIKGTGNFKLQVCQKTFLNVLGVSKDRVQRIDRNHLQSGEMPTEKRGGDKISQRFAAKKDSVRCYIQSLKNCSEIHYCRGKSESRQYLPGILNINKIFRAYNDASTVEMKVKKTFFRTIFTEDYNIGFGTPVTDACSVYISLKEQIKVENDPDMKSKIMIEYHVHKLRAKAFFSNNNKQI